MRMLIFFLTLLAIVFTSLSEAQIPRMLSYQGVLSDSLGNPKPNGDYTLIFRLYESSSGGTANWTETKTLPVKRGLFYTMLGDQTPFADSVRFDKQYWLSIQVGGDPELSPRIPLTGVGYSISSIKADTARYAVSSSSDTVWKISSSNIYHLNGNVGIGTTSPQALLQLGSGTHGLGNVFTVLDINYDDAGSYFIEIRNNNNYALMGNNSSQAIYGGSADVWISPGTVAAMVLKPGGNVGIGTATPTEKLQVAGNIRIGNATMRSGTGNPDGVVTGNVGDLFLRTDGGAGSTLYVKESGNGTGTGWIAK